MSGRRRIIWYSGLILLAGGMLVWQWWSEPRYGGERLATWLRRVSDRDPAVRADAATALGKLADGVTDSWFSHDADRAWKELVTMSLYDADDTVREKAVESLTTLCQFPGRTNETKRLEHKRAAVRSVLDGFKIGAVEVRRRVPEVAYQVTGLEYYERAVRRGTDDAVDKESRPAAVTALVAALNDPDEDVRDESAYWLGKLDRVPAAAETGLLAQLVSKDAVTRINAATALTKLERISEDAVPGLVRAAQDDVPKVRLAAFDCIVRIGPTAIPALRGAMAKAPQKTRGFLEICLKALDVGKDG